MTIKTERVPESGKEGYEGTFRPSNNYVRCPVCNTIAFDVTGIKGRVNIIRYCRRCRTTFTVDIGE